MDALTKAIDKAGGVGKLATAIGTRQNVVSNWRSRESVPEEWCARIERHTGVRCEELRPDVTWTRGIDGLVTGYHVPVCSGSAAA